MKGNLTSRNTCAPPARTDWRELLNIPVNWLNIIYKFQPFPESIVLILNKITSKDLKGIQIRAREPFSHFRNSRLPTRHTHISAVYVKTMKEQSTLLRIDIYRGEGQERPIK